MKDRMRPCAGAVQLALALLFMGLLPACDALPYRVEWARGSASEQAAEEVVDPARRAAIQSDRGCWTSWITLHERLERMLARAAAGDPVPCTLLADCDAALGRVEGRRRDLLERTAPIRESYRSLSRERRLLSPSATRRKLRRLRENLLAAR